ncbi:response regulator transcription factor [Cohnella abietis]|uniref:DNA-binding response regulator n=1 Tax=Cohnella abietis TaxID=2507935 RepID=A0A3T1D1A2_9BACL|nr:helix-turn-helix domain-containing protein [Cohnella abietis]BBI31887.1 hypothetical protein KCTCHS21_12860 [Cohnella abietis]
MFNLLIVDDEIYAVEGLKSGVNWAGVGFTGVYEAYNIRDAQDILVSVPIDVVICDIEMPGGDGFELIEWIRRHDSDIVTLFLTCHADFHFAQRAIQLGTQDYLLKPVDFAALEETAHKIVASIQQEWDRKSAYDKANTFWESKKPLLVERFWQDVLGSRIPSASDQLRKAIAEYAVPFDPDRMDVLPILISVEQWMQAFNERDEELMEYAIRKVAEEILLVDGAGCAVQERNGANVAFVYFDKAATPDPNEWVRRCEEFLLYCERHFYCKSSCYIGQKSAIERTKSNYEALLKLEFDNISKSRSVHLHKPEREEVNRLRTFDLSEWPGLIEQGAEAALRERIVQSLAILKIEGGNAEALLIYYHSVLQAIYSVLHKRGKSVQEVFAEAEALEPAFVPKTISQIEQWSIRVTGAVSRYVKKDEDSIVQRVKEYVIAHLDDRIERMELADLVHLNPAYLSRLFKKETGESLTEFIQSEKMKLTKQLLRGSDKPISEIAQVAGYSNMSYFSKAFKKMYDMSPLAFRKGSPSREGRRGEWK